MIPKLHTELLAPGQPDAMLFSLLATVALQPDQQFYFCTTHIARLATLLNSSNARFNTWEAMRGHTTGADAPPWPLTNLAIGVPITTQAEIDERIPVLQALPVEHRFVVIEAVNGDLDFSVWLRGAKMGSGHRRLMNTFSTVYIYNVWDYPTNMHPNIQRLRLQLSTAGVVLETDQPAWIS